MTFYQQNRLNPTKLKRHFDIKHQNFSDKDVQFFKSKADGVKKGRLDAGGRYQQQNVAAVEASYLVALRIALRSHTQLPRIYCCLQPKIAHS